MRITSKLLFSTVVFAENNKDLIQQLLSEGHELASHTWFHSDFEEKHLSESKELEQLFDTKVVGLRMPRMSPVSEDAVSNAGYFYNSSINPTYLPGDITTSASAENHSGKKRSYNFLLRFLQYSGFLYFG
jgi:peptidoglycan/xylan/chitin deacetylase (PgdA/CDA1 family)